jgi:hypothetical protein
MRQLDRRVEVTFAASAPLAGLLADLRRVRTVLGNRPVYQDADRAPRLPKAAAPG